MVLVARITGVFAAIIWFIGTPLMALAGVPFPSDVQYFVEGVIAVLMGLALVPVMLAIGNPIPSRTRTLVRVSGVTVCIALVASGLGLILATAGLLGEAAPRLIPDSAIVVLVAFFVWLTMASIVLRGPTAIERWTFWLGLLTGASCGLAVLASILMFDLAQGSVVTNATVLPLFLVDLLLWLSLPAWLTVVVVGLSPKSAA